MSNNLNLDQVAEAQTSKEVTINDQAGQLDAAVTETLDVDFTSGNVSLTDVQFRRQFQFNATNLSVARTLTVPQIKRFFFVNNAAGTATLNVIRGSTSIQLAAAANGLFYTDGTTNGLVQTAGDAAGGISGIRVEDEGTQIIAEATALDFVGAGVTVTDAGSGEATITIPGGGASSSTAGIDEFFGAKVAMAADVNAFDPAFKPSWGSTDYQSTIDGFKFWLGIDLDFTANSTTDRLTATAHGMVTGDGPFRLTNSGGALPTGLAADTNYWCIRVDDNTIQLATSFANAQSSTAVNFTSNGTGTHTLDRETRLVVPGDRIQKIRLAATISLANALSGSDFVLQFVRNQNRSDTSSQTFRGDGKTGGEQGFTTVGVSTSSGPLEVSSGDFFELRYNSTDTSIDFTSSGTTFTIEVVELTPKFISAYKEPVRAASTANGVLASAFENGDSLDGVTLATGDRILIKNQTTASENGIYTVNASGAPARATDFDENAEVVSGALVVVQEGTANADKLFELTTDGTITVGSTNLTFSEVGEGGGGGAVEFISSIDLSNQATADFTGFNAATYDYYIFALGNVIPATDNVTLLLRTSTNGGSTYDSSGANYGWNLVFRDTVVSNNAIETTDSTSDSASIRLTNPVGSGSFEHGVSGEVKIMFPHLTVKTMTVSHLTVQDADSLPSFVTGGGYRLTSADVDAVRFLFSSGNLESGTITMYGVKNSA